MSPGDAHGPLMGKVPELDVDADLCTERGDCIKALPTAFRKVEGEEVAAVFNTDLGESLLPRLAKTMTECPGWCGEAGDAQTPAAGDSC